MRPLLLALALLASGCGTVLPYSLAPDWLVPDVADASGSAVVVTDWAASPGVAVLAGRVVDGATGAPVAGAVVALADGARAVADADGAFSLPLPDGAPVVSASAEGYVTAAARVEVAPRTRATALVLLEREPAEDA